MRRIPSIPVIALACLCAAGRNAGAAGEERFSGGSYDGYTVTFLYQSDTVAGVSRFSGGGHDGWGYGRLVQRDQQESGIGARFRGGSYDGYTSDVLLQEAEPVVFARFSGGAFDGYESSRFLQEAALIRSPRFFGGSYDGYRESQAAGLTNPLDRDSDGDGMPDWWELPHFGGVTNADADADNDLDDTTEFAEYMADTDPGNPNSVFEITGAAHTNSHTVTFACTNSRVYSLLYATNMVNGEWLMVDGATNIPGEADGEMQLTDPDDARYRNYGIGVSRP